MKHARKDYDRRIQDSAGLIPDDEPVVFIRGQDALAVSTAEAWIRLAEAAGVDGALVAAVREHAQRIADWQFENSEKVKVPDAPEGVL